MVCGEVIRRAAGLEWVIGDRGDWFVASIAEDWPAIAICPLTRLYELKCSSVPQFGKHLWLVQRAAFECLLFCSAPEREPMIRELLECPGDYLEHMAKTLEALRGQVESVRTEFQTKSRDPSTPKEFQDKASEPETGLGMSESRDVRWC